MKTEREKTAIRVGYVFVGMLGCWKLYKRQSARTGPGMYAHTEYSAFSGNDFYKYSTEHRSGSTPIGFSFSFKEWRNDLLKSNPRR